MILATPEPMQIDCTQLSLTAHERCKREWLCLYCWEPNHTITGCLSQSRNPPISMPAERTPVASLTLMVIQNQFLSCQSLMPYAQIKHRGDVFVLPAMINSGAAANCIDCHTTVRLKLCLQPLKNPLNISTIDGGPISSGIITQRTKPLQLQVSGLHLEKISFLVTVTPEHPIILGFPWMQRHNPWISWSYKEITKWSLYCFEHCLHRPHNTIASTTIDSPNDHHQVHVSKVYHSFLDISSKTKASGLPPHHLYDCAIDLLPGTTPPHNRIGPLLPVEQWAMKEYYRKPYSKVTFSPQCHQLRPHSFLFRKRGRTLFLYWIQRVKPDHRKISLSTDISPVGTGTALWPQDFHQTWSVQCIQPGAY